MPRPLRRALARAWSRCPTYAFQTRRAMPTAPCSAHRTRRHRRTRPDAARHVAIDLVLAEVVAVLGLRPDDEIDLERTLLELGFDSMAALDLHKRLVAGTGIDLPPALVIDHPTPAALWEGAHRPAPRRTPRARHTAGGHPHQPGPVRALLRGRPRRHHSVARRRLRACGPASPRPAIAATFRITAGGGGDARTRAGRRALVPRRLRTAPVRPLRRCLHGRPAHAGRGCPR